MKKLVFALAALTAIPLFAIQGTIRTENESKSGDIKWQPGRKVYQLSFKKGKIDGTLEYKPADVVKLDIAKPASYDKLVEMVSKGQGSSAIVGLQKIVSDYKMLVWDKPAGRYLALAYIDGGQAQKAYEICRSVIDEDKRAAYSGDLAPAYWQSLLRLGKTDQLKTALKKAVTEGDRAAACAAASMQGDIIMADGESAANFKRALTEGYLKAFLMFADPECQTERYNAAMKAAECFDKLGQAARAEKIRTQAKSM